MDSALGGLLPRFANSAKLSICCDLGQHDLSIVNGRDIRTRFAGQHRKGRSITLHGPPRQRPRGKRRFSDRMLITGGPFGRPGGNPQRN